MHYRLAALAALAVAARTSLAALYHPSPQASFLEHILVDNWGAYASNFSSAITPCSNYVTEVGLPALNSGRTTAAQWMRVAFHDFVTADVAAGTGGVDASIGFETARGENSGSAFNDSFTFWAPFVNDAVSSKAGSFPFLPLSSFSAELTLGNTQWPISSRWGPSCRWGCAAGCGSPTGRGGSMRWGRTRRRACQLPRRTLRRRWAFSRGLGSTSPTLSG